jgi:hypothetical protein
MSAEQTRRTLNQLDKDIVALEKKSADYAKKEAAARGNAARVSKSISKNTSPSTLKNKLSQIDRYNSDAIKAASDKADTDKKLADKQKKRADTYVKLQKDEADERKKEAKAQKSIQQGYEKRIEELTRQLNTTAADSIRQSADSGIKECDVFISHAWEDKEGFVDEFVNELELLGVKTWYDKQQISWGDSMRAKIDEGLAKSRFGVVIISPNYIADGKYWTKTELDGLFQLESVNGKTILPVWHNITKKDVMAYSPIIAGKLAMTTATMTPIEIAVELLKLLPKNTTDSSFVEVNDESI